MEWRGPILGLLFLGCSTHLEAVRDRFQRQYRCGSVSVEDIGSGSVRATGCGIQAMYVCSYGAFRGPARGDRVCVEERSTAAVRPPAPWTRPAAPPQYDWPPAQGTVDERFDEFERATLVRVRMTVGTYIVSLLGTPGPRPDSVALTIAVPGGGPQYAQCNELDFLIDGQLVRVGARGHLRGPAGEEITRFDMPPNGVDGALGVGMLKARFCGLEWQFTPEQIVSLRAFRSRFMAVATREARIAAPPAPPAPLPPPPAAAQAPGTPPGVP